MPGFDVTPDAFHAWLAGLPAPAPAPAAAPTEVPASPEFMRIRDAERVDWRDAPDLDALVNALTAHLKTPTGTQTLKPIQAAALRALFELGAAVMPGRTGIGKTHPSFLAAEITDAARPLLLVPAKLINSGKTHREHAKCRVHWRLRPILSKRESLAKSIRDVKFAPLRVVSYEALSRVEYEEALQNWAPDLIIADECHKLKDTKSGVTRRLSRYVRAFRPKILLLTGSLTNRSVKDYHHYLRWALGDACPLPRTWNELQLWSWALDEKVPDAVRVAPGALLGISPAEPDDGEGIRAARKRYARRLRTTPGVIASGDELPPAPLLARVEKRTPDPRMLEIVKYLRDHWETPCGHPFELATELWARERQVSCDFYYRWKRQPPPEWKRARRDWSAFVREVLSHSRTYDTGLAVSNAIDRGQIRDGGILAEWRRVAHMFDPSAEQEPVFFGESTTRFVADWLARERGIAWVQHVAFGERLSEISGVPYFAAGGKAIAGKLKGTPIDTHRGPAIASIKAINEGFNLQDLHCKNLIVTCPTTNLENEQLISRTHRDGQENDVEITYLETLEGDSAALAQARADARYVESSTLQPQRLNAATWLDE